MFMVCSVFAADHLPTEADLTVGVACNTTVTIVSVFPVSLSNAIPRTAPKRFCAKTQFAPNPNSAHTPPVHCPLITDH